MPANIAKINGKDAVALAREPAWHGLGTVVDHLMKAEEAFKEAQLDWTVEKRQLFNRTVAVAAAEGEPQLADTCRNIVSSAGTASYDARRPGG